MDAINKLLEKLKNPAAAAGVAVVVGFLFGLVWGWVIQPVEFVDATPEVLRADYQQDYLRMTIDSFLVNSDTTLALRRWQNLGDIADTRLNEIGGNPGPQDKAAIDVFGQLIDAAAPVQPTVGEQPAVEAETPDGNGMSSTLRYLLIFIFG